MKLISRRSSNCVIITFFLERNWGKKKIITTFEISKHWEIGVSFSFFI